MDDAPSEIKELLEQAIATQDKTANGSSLSKITFGIFGRTYGQLSPLQNPSIWRQE
jgi:hypothetical protein